MSTDLKMKLKVNRINDKGAQLLISNVRCAFMHIAEPSEGDEALGFKPAYELSILIPKKHKKEIEEIRNAILETIKQSSTFKSAKEKTKAKSTSYKIHGDGSTIKDGDKMKNGDGKVYDGLEDHFVIKCKTGAEKDKAGNWKPKVAFPIKDRLNGNIALEHQANELYAGAWYSIALSMKGYSMLGNAGVTCYLSGVQKLKNGERLGVSNPFEVRDDIEEDMGAFEEDGDFT